MTNKDIILKCINPACSSYDQENRVNLESFSLMEINEVYAKITDIIALPKFCCAKCLMEMGLEVVEAE